MEIIQMKGRSQEDKTAQGHIELVTFEAYLKYEPVNIIE